jgi:hypothetical protein
MWNDLALYPSITNDVKQKDLMHDLLRAPRHIDFSCGSIIGNYDCDRTKSRGWAVEKNVA